MRLREPTDREKRIMKYHRLNDCNYFVVEPDTRGNLLVLLHKTRGRRRTVDITKAVNKMPGRKSNCELVRSGKQKRKGKPTIEFYKNGVPQYYCYGYVDLHYDEPVHECIVCEKWVYGEKFEIDFEEAKKEGLLGR